MVRARVIGTGSYLPNKIVTNFDLFSCVKNFDVAAEREKLRKRGVENAENISDEGIFNDWVLRVTGIRERCFVNEETTELMASEASKEALNMTEIKPGEIELIILATFTPTRDIPNPACKLASLLGIPKVPAFPINTACSGFVYGLDIADSYILSRKYKTILVAASETLSKVTDFSDPTTAILFADGAGAAILQATEEEYGIKSSILASDYSEHIILESMIGEGKRYIKMVGGAKVLQKAVEAMGNCAKRVLEKAAYTLEDTSLIIPHQANERIINSLINYLGMDSKKVCNTIEKYGNTSGASVAIALDKVIRGNVAETRINKGDRIVLTAVGGGYSDAAILTEW